MSPVNPKAPPPAAPQRAVAVVKAVTYRHRDDIEVAVCGGVLAVAIVLAGLSVTLAVLCVVTYTLGAFIQALIKRGR